MYTLQRRERFFLGCTMALAVQGIEQMWGAPSIVEMARFAVVFSLAEGGEGARRMHCFLHHKRDSFETRRVYFITSLESATAFVFTFTWRGHDTPSLFAVGLSISHRNFQTAC